MILESSRRTGRVVTAEEAQIVGGFVVQLLIIVWKNAQLHYASWKWISIWLKVENLWNYLISFGLTGEHIADKVEDLLKNTPQYS